MRINATKLLSFYFLLSEVSAAKQIAPVLQATLMCFHRLSRALKVLVSQLRLVVGWNTTFEWNFPFHARYAFMLTHHFFWKARQLETWDHSSTKWLQFNTLHSDSLLIMLSLMYCRDSSFLFLCSKPATACHTGYPAVSGSGRPSFDSTILFLKYQTKGKAERSTFISRHGPQLLLKYSRLFLWFYWHSHCKCH